MLASNSLNHKNSHVNFFLGKGYFWLNDINCCVDDFLYSTSRLDDKLGLKLAYVLGCILDFEFFYLIWVNSHFFVYFKHLPLNMKDSRVFCCVLDFYHIVELMTNA